jgi:hypothetical protein
MTSSSLETEQFFDAFLSTELCDTIPSSFTNASVDEDDHHVSNDADDLFYYDADTEDMDALENENNRDVFISVDAQEERDATEEQIQEEQLPTCYYCGDECYPSQVCRFCIRNQMLFLSQ